MFDRFSGIISACGHSNSHFGLCTSSHDIPSKMLPASDLEQILGPELVKIRAKNHNS
jgi:hypothetical protein